MKAKDKKDGQYLLINKEVIPYIEQAAEASGLTKSRWIEAAVVQALLALDKTKHKELRKLLPVVPKAL